MVALNVKAQHFTKHNNIKEKHNKFTPLHFSNIVFYDLSQKNK